jgi:hypothetical protein
VIGMRSSVCVVRNSRTWFNHCKVVIRNKTDCRRDADKCVSEYIIHCHPTNCKKRGICEFIKLKLATFSPMGHSLFPEHVTGPSTSIKQCPVSDWLELDSDRLCISSTVFYLP